MRALRSVLLLVSCLVPVFGQVNSLSCTLSAVPTFVRAEGLAERVGDIVLSCTGGNPGTSYSTNLQVSLNTPVTNRLVGNAANIDVVLTAEPATTLVGAPIVTLINTGGATPNTVQFTGVTVLTSPQGNAAIRIGNLRALIAQQPGTGSNNFPAIQAFMALGASSSSILLTNTQVVVGVPRTGLLGAITSTLIPCRTQDVPDPLTFSRFLQIGVPFFTTRATEGYVEAFQTRQPGGDTGTRIVVRYSGFPNTARVFTPNFLAGSSALQPTAAGDLGGIASGGQYGPSTQGSLLLARVTGTDAAGAGGVVTPLQGVVGAPFDALGEVDVTTGSGLAVYEVLDANFARVENAQIPTFVTFPQPVSVLFIQPAVAVNLGPISQVISASPTAPVPRYAPLAVLNDCQAVGDCGAGYQPRLQADPITPLTFSLAADAPRTARYIQVRNSAGGTLLYSARVVNASGANFVTLDSYSGVGNGALRLTFAPTGLPVGVYTASLVIDAGQAGAVTLPISLTVTTATGTGGGTTPPPTGQPAPQVYAAGNAASFGFGFGPLVPGSLVSLLGANLAGQQVSVTFDGLAAQVLFTSPTNLQVLLPAEFAGRNSAVLVVTVDGVATQPRAVILTTANPAIFTKALLNQDGTFNSVTNPARLGSILQIYCAGLPIGPGGLITARIHDRFIAVPYYAGPAPGVPGVQQVNVQVPEDLPAMTTGVQVCGATAANPDQRVCSASALVTIAQ